MSLTFNMHCVIKGSHISEVIDMEGVGSGVELCRLSFLLYNVTLSKLLTILFALTDKLKLSSKSTL